MNMKFLKWNCFRHTMRASIVMKKDNIPRRFFWIMESNYSTHSTYGRRLYCFRHIYGLTTRSELTHCTTHLHKVSSDCHCGSNFATDWTLKKIALVSRSTVYFLFLRRILICVDLGMARYPFLGSDLSPHHLKKRWKAMIPFLGPYPPLAVLGTYILPSSAQGTWILVVVCSSPWPVVSEWQDPEAGRKPANRQRSLWLAMRKVSRCYVVLELSMVSVVNCMCVC